MIWDTFNKVLGCSGTVRNAEIGIVVFLGYFEIYRRCPFASLDDLLFSILENSEWIHSIDKETKAHLELECYIISSSITLDRNSTYVDQSQSVLYN